MVIDVEMLRTTRASIRKEVLECEPLAQALDWAVSKGAAYFPSAGNLGDGLIGLGALDVFEHFGCRFDVLQGWHTDVLAGARFVVVGGNGGFLEGLWSDYARVLAPFFEAGGEAVILPCTVSGFREFFQRYGKQMTIFARERVSFDHLRSISELSGRVHLCHDLAFAVDYEKTEWPVGEAGTGAKLSLLRSDEESRGGTKPRNNIDLALLWNGIQWSSRETCMPPLTAAVQLIHRFDEITSDRLHMSALSALMGKRVVMRPNGYFKNRAVFDYTLHRFEHVCFADGDVRPDEEKDEGSPNIWMSYRHLQAAEQGVRAELTAAREQVRATEEKSRVELAATLEQLSEQRERVLEVARRYDDLAQFNHMLEQQVHALQATDFRGSRAHRLWLFYLSLYDKPGWGALLRAARKMIKPAVSLRRAWLRRRALDR